MHHTAIYFSKQALILQAHNYEMRASKYLWIKTFDIENSSSSYYRCHLSI